MSLVAKDFIAFVVQKFYEKATTDVLIGYHFNHIQDFKHHFERLNAFWEMHLLKVPPPFIYRLMMTHAPLGIKPGEVNRWVKLFLETIDENESLAPDQEIIQEWREKIKLFQDFFLTHPALQHQT